MPLPPPRRPLPPPPAAALPPAHRAPAPERVTGKMILQLLGVIVLLGLAVIFLLMNDDSASSHPKSEITADSIAKEMRLYPLPSSASEVKILQPEHSLTQALTLRFNAPPAEVERWLDHSAGTQRLAPRRLPDGLEYRVPQDPFRPNGEYYTVVWQRTDSIVTLAFPPETPGVGEYR